MATMSARYTVIDGEVVAQERGGVRHQLVPDPLGSTVALYDSAGTKTDTFGYWPYGESTGRTGSTTMRFQYVGNRGYDQDGTGRNYVRMRYLDKNQGRWVTEDPLRFEADMNFYRYSLNQPISLIDPSGLQAALGCMTARIETCLNCGSSNRKQAVDEASGFCAKYGKIVAPFDSANSLCNAMQHCNWTCLTEKCGKSKGYSACGLSAGDWHESTGPFPGQRPGFGSGWPPYSLPGNPPLEECMDKYNNKKGSECGASGGKCYDCCLQKAKSGELGSIIRPRPNPIFKSPYSINPKNCKGFL
jgi:RHS repeat-associated protein